MDDALRNQLRSELERFEGRRELPYDDKTGKPLTTLPSGGKVTIGIGRNLSDKPLSPLITEMLFAEDLGEVEAAARRIFPHFDAFSQNRRCALLNLLFNLGETRFRKFERTIGAVNRGYWSIAARQVADSLWARQVQKDRVTHVINQLSLG